MTKKASISFTPFRVEKTISKTSRTNKAGNIEWYRKFVVNFIPIVLLYLLVTYTREFAKFSHTILGKALAVILILFYLKMDKIIGILVCVLVIFYYQTDYVESFNNMLNNDEKEEGMAENDDDGSENYENEEKDESMEDFDTLENAYPENNLGNENSIDTFRKTYCKNGHLLHKGQYVPPEMAEHVYPEIKQKDFHKCNICDANCDVEIINKRLIDEADIKTPKSSNDLFDTVWENLKQLHN